MMSLWKTYQVFPGHFADAHHAHGVGGDGWQVRFHGCLWARRRGFTGL